MRQPRPSRSASPTVRRLFDIQAGAGVSCYALADRLKTSQSLVATWKAGRSAPSILAVEALAQELGYRLVLVRNDG